MKKEMVETFLGARCTEMKAPSKKTVVSTAMAFIAELSRLLAAASSFESRATSTFRALSLWAMRLNSCDN